MASIWAAIAAPLTFVAIIVTMWARDQGGTLWLLALPLGLVAAGLAATSVAGLGFAIGTMIRQRRTLSWRHAHPFVIYLMLLIVGWSAFQLQPLLSRISDDAMIANFYRHQHEFERIRTMSEADRRFTRIAPTFTHPEAPRPSWDHRPGVEMLPPERWDTYRALFQTTGNADGIGVGKQSVQFYYWTAVLVIGGAVKGYVYSASPLTPLVDSLDHISSDIDTSRTVYRQFADGWHLFYESYD